MGVRWAPTRSIEIKLRTEMGDGLDGSCQRCRISGVGRMLDQAIAFTLTVVSLCTVGHPDVMAATRRSRGASQRSVKQSVTAA
jgi:hypothetical protein